jgi:electron transfer flavoprotein beta subunit
MSVVPAMLAERLGWAQLTFAGSVAVDPAQSKVSIARSTEFGIENMEATFPAVVSVIEKINEPRYPSFKGIMAAKKKTIAVKSLADIGLAADQVGSKAAWSNVKDAVLRPARSAGIKVEDGGDGGTKLVDFLAEKRVI